MTEQSINTDTHFAQPKITGYRQLSYSDVSLMNQIKELGKACGEVVATLEDTPGLDQRWISVGATELQQGFMALVRSVAQPTTF